MTTICMTVMVLFGTLMSVHSANDGNLRHLFEEKERKLSPAELYTLETRIRTGSTTSQNIDADDLRYLSPEIFEEMLIYAVQENEVAVVESFLKGESKAKITTESIIGGVTPLMAAAGENDDDQTQAVIKLLVHYHANVNYLSAEAQMTPLMIAAVRGNQHNLAFLLRQPGIDVNKQNEFGSNALFYAVMKNHFECAKLLLEAGAATDQKGFDKTYQFAHDPKNNIDSKIKQLLEQYTSQ